MTPLTEFDPVEQEVHRRLLEGALHRIRQGGHPLLRDMAESLLKGEMTLDELTRSSVAAPVLQAAATSYLDWRKGLTQEEHGALVAQVSARVDQLREDLAPDKDMKSA
ncbi:hypothetical protein Rhe02_64100 [Rhizocola hellebori]|uniref:Uncharacterized protein n=2 Tax=Rhizocola hellebori TaxID=1392758 RepID=A0A8J3QCJ9_9ACTN|nr:hypothetical protein Rhe02_64100 [Rhizocola hellebori]